MNPVVVDALGEKCPIPVVKTRKALQEHPGAEAFVVYVSDENAARNVQRLAQNKGGEASVVCDAPDHYTVNIAVNAGAVSGDLPEEETVCGVKPTSDAAAAIGSAFMGTGSEELGGILMKGFIYALSTLETPPKCVLFYNGGAQFTCEGSPALEDIRKLEERGTAILTCGTCLDYYGLKDKLAVGQVTNMYTIVETMMQASHVIKP